VPVEIDPEVGGEHERETATLLESGLLDFPFVGGEVRADEDGVGAVEGGVETVGRARAREGGGGVDGGEVEAGEGVAVGSRLTALSGARGEEEAQPVEGARDKVGHVDAPCKRWPCPGRSSHLAGVFSSSTLHLYVALCIQVQRDPHDCAGHYRSTLDI
jgi:hypothetical protein